ncbi:peptidyl-prolyl cis-trans isomerase FKBP8 [Chelonus insularis]|uniref:peptidyl-prolyl cis-trans isomerase FKBP8 n=1 Tax=Chelonus insularis TaxID=460826 RepID=UPI00158EBE52|nr:peptidyl-prolyl cis-trans isomerase FKBP8 [Chelonus insularis]
MEVKSAASMNINENEIHYNSQEDFIKNELNFDVDASVIDDTVHEQASQSNDEDPEWMDILGNGQLRKKILVKGSDKKQNRPNQGDICTLRLIGRLEDGKLVENLDDTIIQLGDHEVVQGLDLAIALMNIGETAEIEVAARFAYGDLGKEPDIPPGAKVIYEVELKKVEIEPEIDNIDVTQRLNIGIKKRERGNWWFSRNEPTIAIQCYRRALEYFQPLTKMNHDEKNEQQNNLSENTMDSILEDFLQNRTKIYNNLAAAQLKTEAYEAALESVENVLRVEPENVKALYRKGCILQKKGEYTEAMNNFNEAARIDPESTAISHQIKLLKVKNAQSTASQRDLYRKMFGTTANSKTSTNNKNKNSTSFLEKYLKLPFVISSRKTNKLLIWSLIGGTFVTVMGVVIYKLIEN